ncbi:MAG: 1-acyl-sn-glycerol-3-phosphate acyltransferase [Bacteroidales bacterium OttesenSCG-928-I14]|nr:1-acyl-sn-glycerol-3-phosphate acyltransferase [Bacteroidales bacterium OttesenSCG-928-I14]
MKSCKTIKEFQHNIIIKTISDLINRTTKNISSYGIETLEKNKSYTFISNHRDILLDASILCIFLVKKNYETVEIAIGDNLLIYQWIEDIVRLNKSFIVKRTPDFHQLLNVTTHLSKYIHFIINEKKESLWIAQREGRAKNSDDRTQKSILKMLIRNDNTISPEENIKELNLIPVSISYEYDPCDFLKAKEAQQKRDNPKFRKIQKDDFISMKTGLLGYKGNVHIQLGKSINSLLLELKNANIKQTEDKLVPTLARMIDKEIFLNYKFFPINYIAYEKLFGKKNCFIKKYTNNDLKIFKKYLNQQLNKIKLKNKDIFFLKEKILEMYAYPLKNQISVKK